MQAYATNHKHTASMSILNKCMDTAIQELDSMKNGYTDMPIRCWTSKSTSVNSAKNKAKKEDEPFLFDTGANIWVTSPEDPLVIQLDDTASSVITTTDGDHRATPGVMRTPCGIQPCVTMPGAGRIMPSRPVYQNGRAVFQNGTAEISYKGRDLQAFFRDDLPRIPASMVQEVQIKNPDGSSIMFPAPPQAMSTRATTWEVPSIVVTHDHEGLPIDSIREHGHRCKCCGTEYYHKHKIKDAHWTKSHFWECCPHCLKLAGKSSWRRMYERDPDRVIPKELDKIASRKKGNDPDTEEKPDDSEIGISSPESVQRRLVFATQAKYANADGLRVNNADKPFGAWNQMTHGQWNSLNETFPVKDKVYYNLSIDQKAAIAMAAVANKDTKEFTDLLDTRMVAAVAVTTMSKTRFDPQPGKAKDYRSAITRAQKAQSMDSDRVTMTKYTVEVDDWRNPIEESMPLHPLDYDRCYTVFFRTPNVTEQDIMAHAHSSVVTEVKKIAMSNTRSDHILQNYVNKWVQCLMSIDLSERANQTYTFDKCEEHAKDNHAKWDPDCEHCVRASLWNTQHRRKKKNRPDIGRLDFDLVVYQQDGPYIAVGHATDKKGNPILLAEPILKKTEACIQTAIGNMIVAAQHVYACNAITRVHGDGEASNPSETN